MNIVAGTGRHTYKKVQNIYVHVTKRTENVSHSGSCDRYRESAGIHWTNLLQIRKRTSRSSAQVRTPYNLHVTVTR